MDFSKLNFGDEIDERTGFVYDTREIPKRSKKAAADFAQSILIYSKHYYGGIVLSHITRPDVGIISTSRLPAKLTIHTGANINFLNDSLQRFTLSPNIIFLYQGGFDITNVKEFSVLLPGITGKYKWFSLGISYRRNDAFIATVGFQNRFLKVGYSYDYTAFGLTNKTTGGSHEVQLTWFLSFRKKPSPIKSWRLI